MTRGGVLVTGASTGIGEATALRLDASGFTVFAGVRSEADAARLRAAGSSRLRVLQPLDVTDPAHVADAAATVERELGGEPLAGIVNNAGVSVAAPLEALPLDELRRQMEVNTVAPLAVIQAFLPQLRRSRGRIVNVTSIGGRVAQPLIGAYAASKFALEALGDSLRRELMPWGIEVVAVEPGTIKTPIWEKGEAEADAMVASWSAEHRALYEERVTKVRGLVQQIARRGVAPDRVAAVIEKALTADRPRPRYMVGDAYATFALDRLLPTRVVDRLLYRLTS
jgi:NAD(P)-dependent dehydrogenase (short-subunit alcohol dehydrogenase family)